MATCCLWILHSSYFDRSWIVVVIIRRSAGVWHDGITTTNFIATPPARLGYPVQVTVRYLSGDHPLMIGGVVGTRVKFLAHTGHDNLGRSDEVDVGWC